MSYGLGGPRLDGRSLAEWWAARAEVAERARRIENNPCTCRHDLQPGKDLKLANLKGANLSGVNLSEADLSGANLEGADLSLADLSQADLSGVWLMNSDLSGANLRGADLSGAKLSWTGSWAILSEAKADEDTTWPVGFDPKAAGVIFD